MRSLLLILCCGAALGACEKAFIEEDPSNRPRQIFNEMWQQADKRYSFFTYKQIDWDSIKRVYEPRISQDMSQEQLFDVLTDMLGELRDDHVQLLSNFDHWQYEIELEAPPNYRDELIRRQYHNPTTRKTGPFTNTLLDSIGYLQYKSFAPNFDAEELDYVLQRFQASKGVIIDVRDNGGGRLPNVGKIIGRFIDQKRTIGYLKEKRGPGHNDFSEPIPFDVAPKGSADYDGPVVVLTNRSCYSATNWFVSGMKSLPDVTIVGDTTGGGGGQPFAAQLSNGWTYSLSINQQLNRDREQIEGGVAPDIRQDMTIGDDNEDEILERALQYLRK